MNARTLLLFSVLCLFWGIPYFFIKLALVDLSPVCVAWGRITLAAIVLLPVAWHRGALAEAAKHAVAIAVFAVTELAIPFSLIAFAEQRLASSLTGILIATVPLTVVVVAPGFGVREPLTASRLAGLGLGLAGVAVLLGLDVGGAAHWPSLGALSIAIVGYAVGPLVVQKHLAGVDEIAALALSLGVASLLLLPLALGQLPAAWPSPRALGSVAVLGLISTAAALLLYFYVIHAAGAARASLVAYVSPGIAALLGIAVLHEPWGINVLLGLTLILGGSALSSGRVRVAEGSEPGEVSL